MTRAESFVKSIQDDIDHLSRRLFDVRMGMVKKVDCHSENMGRVLQVLSDLKTHIPHTITDSED